MQSAECLECVSPNRNLFWGTIPAVQSVDFLDTYGNVSPFVLGVQFPAV